MLTRSLITLALIAAAGCGEGGQESAPPTATVAPPAELFVTDRPSDAPGVTKAKASTSIGDSIRFLARVGGRPEPFVNGHAIFVAADTALVSCELMGDEDHCDIPWDYCCEDMTSLRNGTVTIRLVDESGRPLRASAEGMGGLEKSKFILVEGVVHDRNDDGVFVVDATQVWVGGKPTAENPLLGSK